MISLYKDIRIKYYITEIIVLIVLFAGNEYLYRLTNNRTLELILFFVIIIIAIIIIILFHFKLF